MGLDGKMQVPAWGYEFAADAGCMFCLNRERVVLRDTVRREVGVCEACSVQLYWIWKRLSGDSPPESPVDGVPRPVRVKVLVARRVKLGSGELAPPGTPYSYQVAMVAGSDGTLDLPSADVAPGEGEEVAATRALASCGVGTWSPMLESLYAAHTPRGSLARVWLARAYVLPEGESRLAWRGWPPWKHVARGMEGFYLALQDVWQLRVDAHLAKEPHTDELSVLVREGAAKYVKIQQALRAKVEVDSSMAEYLRRSMTDDEKWVDRVLREDEQRLAEVAAEKAEAAAAAQPAGPDPGPTGFEEDASDSQDPPAGEGDLEVAFREDDPGDGGETTG